MSLGGIKGALLFLATDRNRRRLAFLMVRATVIWFCSVAVSALEPLSTDEGIFEHLKEQIRCFRGNVAYSGVSFLSAVRIDF